MAANAYVLVNVDSDRTEAVVGPLRSIPGASVQEVLGPYDVVVELTGDTTGDIAGVVRSQIRSIPGVTSTVTCYWIEGLYGEGAGGE